MNRLVKMTVCLLLAGTVLLAQQAKSADTALVLDSSKLQKYVQQFNEDDEELYANIPNKDAFSFLKENIPFFECLDADFERTYYFRWWSYRKHIRSTSDGFVITEFLPKVRWSGKHNTICCPAGHHFYEGRWLRDPKYLDDYEVFWLRKGGAPRNYSFWIADSYYARNMVTPNDKILIDLLDDLVGNYKKWEEIRLAGDGMFWQIDDRDGMEVSIGGSGKRATINSYMYGDAFAISRIAEMAGRPDLAKEYRAKAVRLKQLAQQKLWDPDAEFFKTVPRSDYEIVIPRNSMDHWFPKLDWADKDHRGTLTSEFTELSLLKGNILTHQIEVKDGCVKVPDGPGPGVELGIECLEVVKLNKTDTDIF